MLLVEFQQPRVGSGGRFQEVVLELGSSLSGTVGLMLTTHIPPLGVPAPHTVRFVGGS